MKPGSRFLFHFASMSEPKVFTEGILNDEKSVHKSENVVKSHTKHKRHQIKMFLLVLSNKM